MKILVFGEIGQLGQELVRRCGDVELEVRGLDVADFTDPDACVAFVAATDADAVINAVAYTAVDKAEEDEDLAEILDYDPEEDAIVYIYDEGMPEPELTLTENEDGTQTLSADGAEVAIIASAAVGLTVEDITLLEQSSEPEAAA